MSGMPSSSPLKNEVTAKETVALTSAKQQLLAGSYALVIGMTFLGALG
jgi:hypothetical protein